MPADLQCIYPQRVIPLSEVRVLPDAGSGPVAIEVRGGDFTHALEVRVDGLVVEFEVQDVRKLTARLPETARGRGPNEVTVLSSEVATTGESALRFKLGKPPAMVSGAQKLLQTFVRLLFTTPGRDVFARDLGGGAMRIISSPVRPDQEGDTLSDFILAVEQTKRQLVRIQSQDPRIPPDERLLNASVGGVGGDRRRGRLNVEISVTSQTRKSATTGLELR